MSRLAERIRVALAEPEQLAAGIQFLPVARESLSKTDDAIGKTIRDTLLLAATFELITRAAISKASIAGFEFTDFSLIRKVLPALIAFMLYRGTDLIVWRRILLEYIERIVERAYPALYVADFERLLPPSHFVTETILERNIGGMWTNVASHLALPQVLTMTVGPFVFLGYAYWRSFVAFGRTDILLWASLAMATLFACQTVVMLALLTKGITGDDS